MEVGNDPYPHEEVTGLAAFENLEPVSSLSIEPPPPSESETPPPFDASDSDAVPFGSQAHPFSQSARREDRGDATMPLDLTAEVPSGNVDRMFDDSVRGGWDDPDEATRVVTPSMSPSMSAGASHSANLEMDWDDDEPATRMRGDGMLDMPALSRPVDWEDPNSATAIYDHSQHGAGSLAPGASTLAGGRPSPFPPAPGRNSVAPRSQALGAPSPFATTAVGSDNWIDALKGGDRRTWLWAGAGAMGLIAIALITRALVAGPTLGNVTLTTTPADAQVLIDGRPAAGTASPYSLSDVAAGTHEIVVSKSGFVEYRGKFSLARGETKSLPTVELLPSVREVGFSVRSAPAGAEIWVDGVVTDQLTPARFTGVSPGIHKLQLKRPGYADFELQMFVPEATVLQLPTAELTLAGLERAAAAAHVEHSTSSHGTLSASAASGAAKRRALHPTHSGGTTAAASGGLPFAAPSRAPLVQAPALMPTGPAPMPAAGGHVGTLRVNSRPWAQVFVDGRLVGNTPQPGLQLSAGNHKVQLVNQPMGLSKTFSVSIKAGQMVTKVMNLAE